jgi:hypothetical protein
MGRHCALAFFTSGEQLRHARVGASHTFASPEAQTMTPNPSDELKDISDLIELHLAGIWVALGCALLAALRGYSIMMKMLGKFEDHPLHRHCEIGHEENLTTSGILYPRGMKPNDR